MYAISLTELAPDQVVSYFVALFVPLLDAIIPAFPSETAVIALGVASKGEMSVGVAVLVFLAALGAFLGDNLSYAIGKRYGDHVAKRLLKGEKGEKRRRWAENQLYARGTAIIITCRFIPGGRTAVTLTAGTLCYPRQKFVPATIIAATIWANYAFWIGRIGGALGLAVLATLSATRTDTLLAGGDTTAEALTGGYRLAFGIAAGLVVAAIALAVIVLRDERVEEPVSVAPELESAAEPAMR